jgi:hypothetical protein
MKDGQIFARKSTVRGNLDLEYLDETFRCASGLTWTSRSAGS